jgi:hypothetical protein
VLLLAEAAPVALGVRALRCVDEFRQAPTDTDADDTKTAMVVARRARVWCAAVVRLLARDGDSDAHADVLRALMSLLNDARPSRHSLLLVETLDALEARASGESVSGKAGSVARELMRALAALPLTTLVCVVCCARGNDFSQQRLMPVIARVLRDASASRDARTLCFALARLSHTHDIDGGVGGDADDARVRLSAMERAELLDTVTRMLDASQHVDARTLLAVVTPTARKSTLTAAARDDNDVGERAAKLVLRLKQLVSSSINLRLLIHLIAQSELSVGALLAATPAQSSLSTTRVSPDVPVGSGVTESTAAVSLTPLLALRRCDVSDTIADHDDEIALACEVAPLSSSSSSATLVALAPSVAVRASPDCCAPLDAVSLSSFVARADAAAQRVTVRVRARRPQPCAISATCTFSAGSYVMMLV